jgi:hypothetical protein
LAFGLTREVFALQECSKQFIAAFEQEDEQLGF